MIFSVIAISWTFAKGETPAQVMCSRTDGFIAAWHSLVKFDRFEFAYSSHINLPERLKKAKPGVFTENDYSVYSQDGSMWRYEIEKRFNTGRINGSIIQFKDNTYSGFDQKDRSLFVTKADGHRRLCQWWNPLFESFSFLYEQRDYDDDRDPKYNRTDSSSPLLCDLIDIGGKSNILSNLQSVVSFSPGGNTSSFVVRTWRNGKQNEKIMLSEYTLFFERPDDLFPVMMEKKDPAGILVILYKVKEFKKFDNFRFPAVTTSTTYIDGKPDKIVDASLIRFRKLGTGEKIPEIDPSSAAQIHDEINQIDVDPGSFQ